MSDDNKEKNKTFEFPMMPIFGVDLGERLGDLAAGQRQLENGLKEVKRDLKEVKQDLKEVEAKLTARIDALDAKTDKMANTLHRLDERMNGLSEGRKSDHNLLIGLWVTVIAGIVIQFFSK